MQEHYPSGHKSMSSSNSDKLTKNSLIQNCFSLWGPDHDFNMEEVLKELAYFKGITYYTSEFCGLENPLPDCVSTNLIQYANMVSIFVITVHSR